MLHLLHYPRELIAERVVLTPADREQIAACRGAHNRLGLAYQLGFLHLTGRLPVQQPLEILGDLLAWVAPEVAEDPGVLADYAHRQATVSTHQELLRVHLGFRVFDPAEREALSHFVREEATRLEHLPALLAQAEAFLRDRRVLRPALSTLRRLAGEQREQARVQLATRLLACVPVDVPAQLDTLLAVEAEERLSPRQTLKTPAGVPAPRALSRLTAKLDQIQALGVVTLDLAWLNQNLQNALARQVTQTSAHRLRALAAPQRDTALVCFLRQTYHETLDQLVAMYHKLMTGISRRAAPALDTAVKRSRATLRSTLQSFQWMGQALCDPTVSPEAIRTTVFAQVSPERLQTQLAEAAHCLTGDLSAVFPRVMKRYRYLRQFAPELLAHLPVEIESTGSPALLEAVKVLRDLNTTGRPTLPEEAPVTDLPKRLQAFGGTNGAVGVPMSVRC